MTRIIGRITLAAALVLQSSGFVYARGFGGGGFRGGGFGGYHAGGFSAGGYRGGGFGGYHAGGFSAGGYRGGGFEGYRAGGYGGYGAGGYRAGGVDGFRAGGVGGVGGYRAGGVEGFRAGGVSGAGGYRAGGVEGFRAGGVGGVGGYRAGGVEGFRAGGVGGNRFGNTAIGIQNNHFSNYTNFGNRTNINVNRVSNFTNVNVGNRGFGWHSPYSGYHSGWVNGYWGGHYGGWGRGFGYGGWGYGGFGYGGLGYGGWGWGLGSGLAWGLGMGLGYGISSWALGSSLYNWGYSSYYNPYYAAPAVVVAQPINVVNTVPYNYSVPIDTTAPAPEQSVTDAAIGVFDSARAAFKEGDYQKALQLTDQALAKLPNDPTLHEFRAQTLFALGQYDEAAASLYAVLTIGPGWDWTTLIGLYPNVDVYTSQLRVLEAYAKEHPDSASAHFVLASQYMSEGFSDAAEAQLKRVVALQPNDKLTPKLLRQFAKPDETATAASKPTTATVIDPKRLTGTWTAKAGPDTTITLDMKDDHKFTWKVNDKGTPRQFEGESSLADDVLTLTQTGGAALVGRVALDGNDRFSFKAVGDGPEDPGLTFQR